MITFETAAALLARQFCILPARADRKAPTVSWKVYQNRLPEESELVSMFPAPRCCIVCGAVSGNLEILDFDSQGAAFEPFLKKIPSCITRRLFAEETPSGGMHIVYRCTEPVDKNLKLAAGADGKVLIETRGEGGLFLCSPSEGYRCIQGSWDTIPVLTPEERTLLLDAARSCTLAALPVPKESKSDPRPAPPVSNLDTSPAEDYNARGNVREVLTSHGWRFFAKKGDGEEWTRPGKTSGVSATLRRVDEIEIFYVFSSNADPFEAGKGYNPFQVYSLLEHGGDMRRAAETLLKSGVYGQQEVPNYDYLLPRLEAGEEPETEEPDEPEPSEESPETGSIPADLYELPGFMGLIFQDINETAPRLQPEFALATALCAQSLLCHQKYCSPQGFRGNVYCLISGKSGCGKDWGRYYLKELFTQLELAESIRESYQSFPAIQNDIRYKYSPKLILWDEFGKALQMMNLRTATSHSREIIPGLMKLYTSAHTWFTPSIKADVNDKRNRPDYSPIPYPFVSLLGTATPEQLLGNLSMDMVSEGFLGRAFLFEAVDDPDFVPVIRRKSLTISDQVLSSALYQKSSPSQEWDPDQKTNPDAPPETRSVGITPGAERLLNDLLARQTDRVQNDENGVLWARAEEQAEKLALLYAVSADPEKPLLDDHAALWGVRLAEHLTLKRIALAEAWVSDSDFDAKQKEVLRYVRSQGGEVPKDKLRRRFWKWSAKERDDIFNNLLLVNKLFSRKEKTGKRERTVFSTRRQNQQQNQQ